MNAVEIHIVSIYSEEPIERKSWMDEDWVKVDVATNCYGSYRRENKMMPKSDWEQAKKDGYWIS